MYSLQTTVEIGDSVFHIRNNGDFRMVLDCFEALNDSELNNIERMYSTLIIFYEEFEEVDDVVKYTPMLSQLYEEMMKFFNGGEDSVKSNTEHHKLIDWVKDSNLICSAVNNIAKQEVRALDYLHWWTFLGYYTAIGDCPLSNIVAIRYKLVHGDKLEKHEQKFKAENPEYFNFDMRSEEQKEADDYIHKLWGDA